MNYAWRCFRCIWFLSHCIGYLISQHLTLLLCFLDLTVSLYLYTFTCEQMDLSLTGLNANTYLSKSLIRFPIIPSAAYCIPFTYIAIVLRNGLFAICHFIRYFKSIWIDCIVLCGIIVTILSLIYDGFHLLWLHPAFIFFEFQTLISLLETCALLFHPERVRKREIWFHERTSQYSQRAHSSLRHSFFTPLTNQMNPLLQNFSNLNISTYEISMQSPSLLSENQNKTTGEFEVASNMQWILKPLDVACSENNETENMIDLKYQELVVHCHLQGSGSKIVVFFHQFAASTFTWRHIQKELSNQFQCLSFDRVAHGLTEQPPPPYSLHFPKFRSKISIFSDTFTKFLAHSIISIFSSCNWNDQTNEGAEEHVLIPCQKKLPVIVCGCSSSAALTLQIAIDEGPDKILGIVLISPLVYSDGIPKFLHSLINTKLGRPLISALLRAELCDIALKTAFHNSSALTTATIQGYKAPFQGSGWIDSLLEYLRCNQKFSEISKRFNQIKVPVLIISGKNDSLIPPGESEKLYKELLQAGVRLKVVSIPNCGHLPQEEAPRHTTETIRKFIELLSV